MSLTIRPGFTRVPHTNPSKITVKPLFLRGFYAPGVWIQQALTNSIFGPRSAEIEEIYKDAVNPYNNWYDNNYGTDNTSTPDLTNEDQRWDVYVDSAYFILVTMSSVGYGDMYPTTLGGRLTAMSAVVSGVVLIALLVNVVTLQLNLSEVEHNTWNSIIHTQHEKQLKKKAAVLLEAAWLHRRASGNAYFLKMLSQWRAVKQYGIRNRAQLNGHTAAEIIREGIQRDLSGLTIKLDRIERELRSSRAERLVSSNRRPSSNPSSPCTQPDNS